MASKKQNNGKKNPKDDKIVESRVVSVLEQIALLRDNGYNLYDKINPKGDEPSFYLVNHDFLMSPNGHPVAVYIAFDGKQGGLHPIPAYSPEAESIYNMIKESDLKHKPLDDMPSFLEERVRGALPYERLHRGPYPI
ncbi:MAG: hypothetical protein ACMXYL_00310 [Candidatus Woesearchaeota archaeon]